MEDIKAYEFSRNSALVAMLCLVAEGDLEASKVLDYCHHLLTEGLEREYSYVWDGLIQTVLDLGVGPCEQAIQQALEDGLVDPMNISQREIERALEKKQALDFKKKSHPYYRYLNNCIEEMSWWASFNPDPYVRYRTANPRHSPSPRTPPESYPLPSSLSREKAQKLDEMNPPPAGVG